MLTLSGYDNSNGDARYIFVPTLANITVLDTESQDVTQYLISNKILRLPPVVDALLHGWVDALTNATAFDVITANALAFDVITTDALAFDVTETFVAMSKAQNAGETPILFARILNSATQDPLVQSDVDSVSFTIYKYNQASARNGGSGKTPVSATWTNVSVNVADCFLNTPVENDPRVDFAYNFKYEPNTLSNNPFESSGAYSIEFTVTPVSGNRIPVIFNVSLS